VISCSAWICQHTLVLAEWHEKFLADEVIQLYFLLWVEFPRLPTQFWEFLKRIFAPIGHFICHESVAVRKVIQPTALEEDLTSQII